MSSSRPPRKSPFRRPESPASPSPLRTSPLSPLRSSTSTPVLPTFEDTPNPTSPLRNTTNFSTPVDALEESPAQAPIKPISPLFAKSPASDTDSSPTKPTSPLRNSISASPPSINIFEDSFSTAKPLSLRSPPQLDAPFHSPQPTAMSTPGSNRWTPGGLRPTNTGFSSTGPTLTKVGGGSRSTSFLTSQSQFETPNSASRGSTSSNISVSPAASKRPAYGARAMSESNALSKLQPAQVRELRECFQILDRDSDGVVDADDVRDMLNQLGLPSSDRDVEQFFPSAGAGAGGQKSTMAVFLTQISTLLATLSPSAELLNAFSAFDDDDSGQVDLAELRDALLHTIPDQGEQALTPSEVDRVLGGFSSRRAFGKTMMGGKRGEVFKYQEFVNSIAGGKSNGVQVAQE